MNTKLAIFYAMSFAAVNLYGQTAPTPGGAPAPGGGVLPARPQPPGAVPARSPGAPPVVHGTSQDGVPIARELRARATSPAAAGVITNGNAEVTNSASNTNVPNSTTVPNTVGFNTNLLGVFTNRGIVIVSSNANPGILTRGVAAVVPNRRGPGTTNATAGQTVIPDITVTPEDQVIAARVRQVLPPQNNLRTTLSTQTPIHLVVQNGAVTSPWHSQFGG